jgi:nucleoside-diphosphate-sugar epimerase
MRIFLAGASGVIGVRLLPLLVAAGYEVAGMTRSPGKLGGLKALGAEPILCDVYDADELRAAVVRFRPDAVMHQLTDLPDDAANLPDSCARNDRMRREGLATRIQPLEQLGTPEAWRDNDRLRADASKILVDAALAADVAVYVQPTVTFVYPDEGPVSEDTPISDLPAILRSALTAEREAGRFARSGRRGIVLRLGLLDGPGTGHELPVRSLGATLHIVDAARALLAGLTLPSGIYNVCRDAERVSNRRLASAAGWHPEH